MKDRIISRIRITLLLGIPVLASILVVRAVSAGEVHVIAAEAKYLGEDLWTISATILHEDTGWEHYANCWDVITPSGIVLGSRKLLHPHVNESLSPDYFQICISCQILTKCESEPMTAFTGKRN